MVARVWGFQPAPGRGLYRGELGVQLTNSRTESIYNSRLELNHSFHSDFWKGIESDLFGFNFIPNRWRPG
jgi:hypothetical protein